MDKKEKFNYEDLKRKTLEQLRSGKSLFGKDGAFAPLLKDILEAALEGEIDSCKLPLKLGHQGLEFFGFSNTLSTKRHPSMVE